MAPLSDGTPKTAFVFAGGGSLGAIQVGMLQALVHAGVTADLVVGSSVGALNAAFFAGDPTEAGVAELARIWRTIRRQDVFPVTLRGALSWVGASEGMFDPGPLRRLIERNLRVSRLEDTMVPLHVMATNLGGQSVRLSSGPLVSAVLASSAIPMVFPSVAIGDDMLMDGAVSGNTPILSAISLGAERLVVLPTGFACALDVSPRGPVARGFHALSLLIAHQMIRDLAAVGSAVEVVTVPPICPQTVSPFDFTKTTMLIERSLAHTTQWIERGGLASRSTPDALLPHWHGPSSRGR